MGALIFSGLISTLLAIKAYKTLNHRRMPFSKHFILIMLSMSLWALDYAFEVGFMDIEVKYFFARLEYIGIAFVPVAWFLFAAEYSGMYKQFVRKYEKAFFVIPLLAILSMLTNNLHKLHFEGYYLDMSGGFPLLVLIHGPFFWTFYIYPTFRSIFSKINIFPASVFKISSNNRDSNWNLVKLNAIIFGL